MFENVSIFSTIEKYSATSQEYLDACFNLNTLLKLRYYEKATKFEKSPIDFDKTEAGLYDKLFWDPTKKSSYGK